MSVECGTARTSRRVETPGQARTRCSLGDGSETRGKRSGGQWRRYPLSGTRNSEFSGRNVHRSAYLSLVRWHSRWHLMSASCICLLRLGRSSDLQQLELLSPPRVDILCQYFQNSRRRSGHRMGKSSLSPSPNLVDTCRQIPDHPKLLRPCSCQRNVGSSKAATRRV